MHLAYMTVGYDCPFVGEQLKNLGVALALRGVGVVDTAWQQRHNGAGS